MWDKKKHPTNIHLFLVLKRLDSLSYTISYFMIDHLLWVICDVIAGAWG